MKKRRLFGLAFGLVAVLAFSQMIAVGKFPAQREAPTAKGKEKPGEGQRAKAFIAAFNKGDAKAVAAFWVPDGDYIDEDGRVTKGRAALEKLYEKQFAAQKGAKLTVTVTSARL